MARTSQAASIAAIQAILPVGGTFYLDLSNTDPGTTGATGLATTRQVFTPSAGSAAVPSVVSNTNAMTVPTAGTTDANYAMIYTALTGGSYVIGAPLASAVKATAVQIAAGQASFSAA